MKLPAKALLRKSVILLPTLMFVLLPYSTLLAQTVEDWRIVDTSNVKYDAYSPKLLSPASPAHLGEICETSDNPPMSRVRHSTDSGATWKTLFEQKAGVCRWWALLHPDARSYFVFGDSAIFLKTVNQNSTYRFHAHILASWDGGLTWSRILLDSNTLVRDAQMLDPNYGIALLKHHSNIYDSLPDKLPDSLLITKDGWKTWTLSALPSSHSVLNVFCFGRGAFSVSSYNQTTGLMSMYRSVDTGNTWTEGGTFPYTSQITFVNTNDGWAVGSRYGIPDYSGFIAHTSDGGMHWNMQLDNPNGFGLSAVSFADDSNGWAVGDYIYHTTNGGSTWSMEDPPYGSFNGAYTMSSVQALEAHAALIAFRHSVLLGTFGTRRLAAPQFYSHEPGPLQLSPTTIYWNPIQGATTYRLQVGVQLNTTYDPGVYTIPNVDTVLQDTSYTFRSLEPATYYAGRIKALNNTDTSDWRQSGSWFQPVFLFYTISKAGLHSPPDFVFPTRGTHVGSTATVKWSSIPEATSYRVRFMFQYQVPLVDTTVTDTTVTVHNLVAAATYALQIKANFPHDTTDWSNGDYTIVTDELSVTNAMEPAAGTLYPNPASSVAHIVLTDEQRPEHVIAYNELGIAIPVPTRRSERRLELDLRGLMPGMYRLVLSGEGPHDLRLCVTR